MQDMNWTISYDSELIDTSLIDVVVSYMENYTAFLKAPGEKLAHRYAPTVSLSRHAIENTMRDAGATPGEITRFFNKLDEGLERFPSEHIVHDKGRTLLNDINFIQQVVDDVSAIVSLRLRN